MTTSLKKRTDSRKWTSWLATVLFTVLAVAWMYPIVMVVINSFKVNTYITTDGVFNLPNAKDFAAFANYASALGKNGFLEAFFYSLIITVSSVALILVCCSMCAWYVVRVENFITKLAYYLFVFSMVVPFQMLMFTLASTADQTGLNKPWNLCII